MSFVLVTGGSTGIGLAVAKVLASRGDRLVLVARRADVLERAVAELPGEGHAFRAFDVSDDNAWRDVQFDQLRGLVCAAAVLSPIGSVDVVDPDEFRRTLDINLVGTFLAVRHCLSALHAGKGSVVTFAGGGATTPLPRFDAYASSKAAVARLTENLGIALAPTIVNCVSPGFVATSIHDATLAAGPTAAGTDYYKRTKTDLDEGGFDVSEAAELVALLLSGVRFSGKVISAQWDPWRDPEFHRRLTDDPDLATIRRIDGVLFDRKTDGR